MEPTTSVAIEPATIELGWLTFMPSASKRVVRGIADDGIGGVVVRKRRGRRDDAVNDASVHLPRGLGHELRRAGRLEDGCGVAPNCQINLLWIDVSCAPPTVSGIRTFAERPLLTVIVGGMELSFGELDRFLLPLVIP